MKSWASAVLTLTAWSGVAALGAASSLPPGFDPARHMRISEVKDGMKGYGLSVFRGTKLERFDVEVISVLHNFNPKDDVVLVRLSGANLEHTGAIAGMSGSPIYLNDDLGRARMIGAFAYGWPMMKDPVGGVQPIEYMLAIPGPRKEVEPTRASASDRTAPGGRTRIHWSLQEAMPGPWSPKTSRPGSMPFMPVWLRGGASSMLGNADDSTRLRPLATPLMTAGMPQKIFESYGPIFQAMGMTPVQAGGAGTEEGRNGSPAKLEPGSAIAVPMMSGDMDLTAIGTVTEVLDGRVLAFGHPFFGEGEMALPMSSGYIHTVIANLNSSFKLGAATQVRGTLYGDQTTGIAGQIGDAPATIPIEIRCVYADGTLDQTFHYNAAQHTKFTPLLASLAASVAMSASRDLPQYHTLDYDLTLEFANGQKLHMQNRSVNGVPAEMMMMLGAPIMAAMENPFERVTLKKVDGTIKVLREARQAEILSVILPREKCRPGETVKAFVTYRPFRGAEAILPLTFDLPRDLADGTYDFAVLDWEQYLADEQSSQPFRFTAESAEEVFDVLRDYTGVKHDALYLRLLRQTDGVAIGRTAMPRLPSSLRHVLMGAGLSNTTAFVSSTSKVVATDYVMDGQAHFQITIDKDAKVEGAGRPARHEPVVPPGPPRMDDGKPKGPVKPPELPDDAG